MRILRILIFLITAVSFSQQMKLTPTERSNFTQTVAHKAETLENFSGDFTQTKHIGMMKEEAVSTGKMYYLAPNMLKWEYKNPYNYKLLFKDNQLFIDDDGEKSVTSLKSNKLFEQLISLISGSVNGKLLNDLENFEITYQKNGKTTTATVIPKDDQLKNMFKEIILIFNKDHIIETVKLVEEAGDYTQIDFKNIKLNGNLDKTVFEN